VYDRLSEPPSPTDETVWGDTARFYLIGIGGRGLTSLQRYGVFEDVVKVSTNVPGRKDWTPQSEEGMERILTDRKFTPMVLPRDKLVSVLHQHIVDNYSTRVDLNYGYQVRPQDFSAGDDGTSVVVQIAKMGADEQSWTDVSANLVIAADGSARTFANQMEQEDRANGVANPFFVTRYEDDNKRIYKSMPFRIPSDWRKDMNYSVRSKGDRVTFDALPANDKGDYVGVLLLGSDDEMAQANMDPDKFQEFLDEVIPQFSRLFDRETIETTAKLPPSFLPCFRYVGPRLHQGKRTVLLGDCAHTVKPYFGMGANSALEDVKVRIIVDYVVIVSCSRAPVVTVLTEFSSAPLAAWREH
jgi:kynurenine 3-monooxygenase